MERRVGAGAWFAAAGGLALMAPLAFVGVGIVTGVQADAPRGAGVAETLGAASTSFGWAVLALLGVAVLDVVVACGLWMVFRAERPGASALAAAFRIAYAAVFVGAIAMLADARRIAEGAGGASGLGIEDRDTAVLSRLDGFDAAWNAGLVLFGMHLLVIGWLLLRRSGVFATSSARSCCSPGRAISPTACSGCSPRRTRGGAVHLHRRDRAHRVARRRRHPSIRADREDVAHGRRPIALPLRMSASRAGGCDRRCTAMKPHSERETVMSYEEKGTWVYLVVAIVGSTVYLSLVLPSS